MARLGRVYDAMLEDHLRQHHKMAFVSGPRQVGKTTTCSALADTYVSWDREEDRSLILGGTRALATHLGMDLGTASRRNRRQPGMPKVRPSIANPQAKTPVALLDELHKYRGWKGFLKGFYDSYEGDIQVLVTGSGRLGTFNRMGDSLMGRYFLFRMHPLSVAELLHTRLPDMAQIMQPPKPSGVERIHQPPGTQRELLPPPLPDEEQTLRPPQPPDMEKVLWPPSQLPEDQFQALWQHGGFPEPFVRASVRTSERWRRLRTTQLIEEDAREYTQIQQIGQLDALARLLATRSCQPLVYGSLANTVRTKPATAQRWVEALADLHHGFLLRPWYGSIPRSLRKEPKWLLRDWSGIEDVGARAETFVGCHLLKAVEGWEDLGLGKFELNYLRDKDRREVDFAVIRNDKPWMLVEVKQKREQIGRSLHYFQRQTGAPFAFQVVMDTPYEDANCFAWPGGGLRAVPARTFLSQLL